MQKKEKKGIYFYIDILDIYSGEKNLLWGVALGSCSGEELLWRKILL